MRFLYLLFIIIISSPALAQMRWIDLQWEKMDKARSYEVELYQIKDDEALKIYEKVQVSDPNWSKQVDPGKYKFRLRGIDNREVPGEWSELELIDVRLPRPIYVHPLPNDVLKGLEDEEEKIIFEWKAVEGASFYVFEVWNKNGFRHQATLHTNSLSYPIPVAQKYFWRVLPMLSENDQIPPTGEEGGVSFFLQGGELKAPQVSIEESPGKMKLHWPKAFKEEKYEIEMFWLSKNSKWTRVSHNYNYVKNALIFNLKQLSGEYRFTIRTQKEGHKESPYTFIEFEVKPDKRLRISRQRTQSTSDLKNSNPFFYSLGYEFMTIEYSGESHEKDTQLNTSLSGQKFLAEFAYQDFYSVWKHRLNLEAMTVKKLGDSKQLFEVDYLLGQVKRWSHSYVEVFGGLFYRDNLFIEADRFSNQLVFNAIPTLGPMLAVRPMYVLNRRFDLGLDLKAFYNSYATKTPSSEAIEPTLSYKARIALTYHYREETTWTLFSGLYMDNVSYKARTSGDSIASPGSMNNSNSSGMSFGLMMNSFF